MWRRYFIAAALGLFVGMIALTLWLAPRVVDSNLAGATISAGEPVIIRFNVPIDAESAIEHFSMEPAMPGDVRVVDRSLIFKPEASLPFGLPLTITLGSGLLSQNSLPLLKDARFEFRVSAPRLVFMRELEGRSNLWIRENEGLVRQLSDEPYGIWDFNISPSDRGVVVSSIAEDGSDDLVLLGPDGSSSVLLNCVEERCRDGRLQPGGSLLAYEKTRLANEASVPEVWLYDMADGQTGPAHDSELLSEAGFDSLASRFPRWSADGRYLAYFKPDAGMIVILDMSGDTPAVIPANLEIMGEWSPVDDTLAYTELTFGESEPHLHGDESGSVISSAETSLYSHIVIMDLASGHVKDLSEGLETDDGKPAWHPAGESLAVGRSFSGGGRQVWIVDPKGEQSVALSDDPFYHHTGLVWSPDGQFLALMRSALASLVEKPSVWILDVDSGQMELGAEDAFLPGWLP